MKLFYFTTVDLGAYAAGCADHVEGIAGGLHEAGWDVTLFSADGGVADQPAYPFDHVLFRRGRSLPGYAAGQVRLLRMLRRRVGRPDAVYVRAAPTLLAPHVYALRRRIPCFVEVNSVAEFEHARRWLLPLRLRLEDWLLRRARGVFVVTEELGAYVAARAGLARERFRVVPNGCAARLLEASRGLVDSPPEGVHTVGFLGSFQPWQGMETVLRAMARLAERMPESRLLLGGSGPLEGAYRSLADELGLARRVSFAGPVAREAVGEFLAGVAVAVCPRSGAFAADPVARHVGTSPVKLFTYLACGRVVVASELPSLARFGECPAVRFARPDDPEDFARALEAVLRMHPARRAELGRAGQAFVRGRYTWDQLARRTGEAIQRWCHRAPAAETRR
ncbi:MAG: glycosyltransferase family 4 protein [Candidatus Brocadiia bacterium]